MAHHRLLVLDQVLTWGRDRPAAAACARCLGFPMIHRPRRNKQQQTEITKGMARILVIGGEELFETVRGLLAAHGYAIRRAADGREAAVHHAETPADLVIAGPRGTDGEELDALLDLIRDNPRLKIVTVSETGTDAYLKSHAAASTLGAVAAISQPIAAEELLFHVLACLEPLD